MRILSLSLQHFRSYDTLILHLDESRRQFFVGENGSGKTNLIEAVSVISQGRSCLKADALDMIRWGSDFYRIDAELQTDGGETRTVSAVHQVSPRKASAYFVQDVRTPLLQFIGVLPTITFLPQDLGLFTGPPSGRRSFVDTLLSQLQPDFGVLRLEYERVLKQRNALLKSIALGHAKETDLGLWDEQLVASAEPIWTRRHALLQTISLSIQSELHALGEDMPQVSVSWNAELTENYVTQLRRALVHYRSRDLILQSTSSGPHRDDWTFLSAKKNIAAFASRGQQRSALLGLLFVSAELFKDMRHERPVILLDDVLSELDDHHQRALVTRLVDHQILITSTHMVDAAEGLTLWRTQDGSIERV